MRNKTINFCLLFSLLLVLGGIFVVPNALLHWKVFAQDSKSKTGINISAAPPAATAIRPDLADRLSELLPEERVSVLVYENCNRSAVNINMKSVYSSVFSNTTREVESERGSGIVLDKNGHILTNYHVVEGNDSIEATLFNGKSYPAEKVGEDPITDITVLKINAPESDLIPVVMADSSKLLVGQQVYAIGNPFGLERTLTSGMISSLNRTIGSRVKYRPIKQAIQTDAAINPGNSGGPLLDTKGHMIGMNTAIASRVGENSGVGFAIPTNTIQRIVSQLLKDGKVVRAEIGIQNVLETKDGLMIVQLAPEGAAERAGLQGPKTVREQSKRSGITMTRVYTDASTADVIVAVDETPAKTAEDFLANVEEHKAGDRVVISVLRNGKSVKIPVVLE